jgi:hypothetical protein
MGGYRRTRQLGTRADPNRSNAYAYGNQVDGPGGLTYGWEGGFGLNSGLKGEKDGFNAESNLVTANGFFGARSQQEADGSVSAWHGAGAEGKVADVTAGYGSPGEGAYAQVKGEALSAKAVAQFNEERGANASVGADLVGVEGSFGHLSKDSGHDVTAKVGASFGVGVGGGVHWADEDGDGIREIGINGSLKLGPGISFDLRSETLGQGYKYLEDNVPAAWDAASDWTSGAWDSSTEAVGNAWNATTGFASDLWDNTSGAVSDGWDATTGFASDAWDSTSGAVSDGWNATTGFASDAWDSTSGAVSDGWNATTDLASKGWDTATDVAGDTWDSVSDGAGAAVDWASDGLSTAGSAIASVFSGW